MKIGPFIDHIADVYRVNKKTVAVFARFLREAGLLTSGGRGCHAPHMQPIDAARMTIALLATDKPARAVERVQQFAGLTALPEGEGYSPALGIVEGATLEIVLTNLFSAEFSLSLLDRFVSLSVNESERTAFIEFFHDVASLKGGIVFFKGPLASEKEINQRVEEGRGIRLTRQITSADLYDINVSLRCS